MMGEELRDLYLVQWPQDAEVPHIRQDLDGDIASERRLELLRLRVLVVDFETIVDHVSEVRRVFVRRHDVLMARDKCCKETRESDERRERRVDSGASPCPEDLEAPAVPKCDRTRAARKVNEPTHRLRP